jgi:hypothetical protein
MNRLLILISMLVLPVLASAQCTSATVPEQDVILKDSNEHSNLGHSASTGVFDIANPTPPSPNSGNIHATCNYTAPSSGSTCNTSCGISFGSGGSTSERGTLNASGTHNVFMSSASGQGSAAGAGASCTGAFGGGTANCGLFGCSGVGLTVSVVGGGATATLSGLGGSTAVWTAATPVTLTCSARSVRTTTTGGVPPDPCLNGATQGPTGSFGTTGDGGGGGNAPECSPIIIDTVGEGFHLTSASEGVSFDISGTGHPVQIAWTSAGSRNAFLALPGADGLVHNGKQLFGNFTPQPQSPNPNGFLALDQYDLPQNGGNGDKVIDENDAVFSRLRLWIDEDHDGVAQAKELHTLPELGVHSLALNYFESRRIDDFGNQFRYRARVNPGDRREPEDQTPSGDVGRWAYDVFFVIN